MNARIGGLCLSTVLSLCSEHVVTCGVNSDGGGRLIFAAFSRTADLCPSTGPVFRDSEKFRCAGGIFRRGLISTNVVRDVSHINEYLSGTPVRN